MKRKGLIITAAATLLAVSCGKGGGGTKPQKGYSEFVKAIMTDAFGEVLPYVSLNKDTLYYGFEYYDGEGYFFVGDDNETNLLETYDEELIKAGYEYVEPEDEFDEPYFYKETETNEIYVTYAYYEATEDYEAGNEIDVEFYYEDPQYESISLELGNLFFNELGLKNTLQLPDYEGEEIYKGVSFSGELGIFEIDIYNSSQEEMDAYAEALEEAGFAEGEPEYTGDYFFYDDKTYATIEVQNWIGFGYDCIRILCYKGVAPLTEFPADLVAGFLKENYDIEVDEDAFPEYDGNEETYFKYDDSWAGMTGGTDVYVNNTTQDEFTAYIEDMEDFGWVIKDHQTEYDAEDPEVLISEIYRLVYETEEDQPFDVACIAYNYLVENGYIDFMFLPSVKSNFPAAAIKADLVAHGIETDTLPEYSGEEATGFNYIEIDATGKGQLQITTAEGDEGTAVLQYQSDLAEAGFEEAGPDTYGDMHYTSPTEGFDVCVWNGVDIGQDGMIFVDIELPKEAGWLAKAIEDYIKSRGTTGYTAPDFSSLEEYVTYSGISSYGAFQIQLDGDVTEALFALMVGYTIPDEPHPTYGYECFDPDLLVEMDIKYFDSYGFTNIYVYAYADLYS